MSSNSDDDADQDKGSTTNLLQATKPQSLIAMSTPLDPSRETVIESAQAQSQVQPDIPMAEKPSVGIAFSQEAVTESVHNQVDTLVTEDPLAVITIPPSKETVIESTQVQATDTPTAEELIVNSLSQAIDPPTETPVQEGGSDEHIPFDLNLDHTYPKHAAYTHQEGQDNVISASHHEEDIPGVETVQPDLPSLQR